MGANVMCVTSAGGMPLFARHVGNSEPLSFSAVGSLNGVHLFSKSHGVKLIKTSTETSTVLWKEYEGSLILIALSVLNDATILEEVLDTVFASMVCTVGIEDLKNIKIVERLKRELRPCYAIIDKILECLDFGDRSIGCSSQLLKYVGTILCTENPPLQTCLDGFVESVNSLYGCMTIENRLAVATQAWWDLEIIERKLLSHIISANSKCTAFDVPVFLPQKSPNVPLRLVGVSLIFGVWVCVLCGPKPDIIAVQQAAFQIWSPLTSTIRSALNTAIRNIPSTLQIHPSVLGFLVIDVKVGRYLVSICSTPPRKESRSPCEVLKTFYYQAASVLLTKVVVHKALETYWCSEYYKVHGLLKGDILLCSMYGSSVPTHTMRLISEETFSVIKDSGW